MSRPTRFIMNQHALVHNLNRVKALAPGKKIIAMVKANAYGCDLHQVVPVLDGMVDAFGVACLEEALAIRALGSRTPCLLVQGVFSAKEYPIAVQQELAVVVHTKAQVEWLLKTPLVKAIQVWVKVNTGMHRLGFKADEVPFVVQQLKECAWVQDDLGLMTHFACADEPQRPENQQQMDLFATLATDTFTMKSLANSAAIMALPKAHADAVRPGIMLYGVSPFSDKTARELNLQPVMSLVSAISAIHENAPGAAVGYSGTWTSEKPSRIAIVPVGYGDGYPRHIAEKTPVWVKGRKVPVVGRVSMDMLTIDLTGHEDIQRGDAVELWGPHIPIEHVAKAANTIAYELLCQVTQRPR